MDDSQVDANKTIDLIHTHFFGGINRRDFAPLLALYSENVLIHGLDGPKSGHKALLAILEKWLEAIPDLQISPFASFQEGDVIVVHWHATGVQLKPLQGYEPKRKQIAMHGFTCFRHQAGLIVEHWAHSDLRCLL